MVDIATTEPKQVEAGNTWQWTRDLTDYQAPTWVLTYYLRNKNEPEVKTIIAADDGDGGHAITVSASDSDGYIGGRWDWIARVSSAGVVYTIDKGMLDIRSNLADAANDFRTYNQRCLDAIEAVRENRASTDQASWSIDDRAVSRMTWDELNAQWRRFRNLVAREQGKRTSTTLIRY